MSEWKSYRKKPVVVQARMLNERMTIATREGTIVGEPGDWLIRGVEGELYPCADSVFRKTYEPAHECEDR